MCKRVFERHTSRTHSMLSRSSQSVVVSLMFSMDESVAKYMSTALISTVELVLLVPGTSKLTFQRIQKRWSMR